MSRICARKRTETAGRFRFLGALEPATIAGGNAPVLQTERAPLMDYKVRIRENKPQQCRPGSARPTDTEATGRLVSGGGRRTRHVGRVTGSCQAGGRLGSGD